MKERKDKEQLKRRIQVLILRNRLLESHKSTTKSIEFVYRNNIKKTNPFRSLNVLIL